MATPFNAKDFRIFFGAEVDIDSQGNLDYPDNTLAEFDIVIAAIHSGFKQSKRPHRPDRRTSRP